VLLCRSEQSIFWHTVKEQNFLDLGTQRANITPQPWVSWLRDCTIYCKQEIRVSLFKFRCSADHLQFIPLSFHWSWDCGIHQGVWISKTKCRNPDAVMHISFIHGNHSECFMSAQLFQWYAPAVSLRNVCSFTASIIRSVKVISPAVPQHMKPAWFLSRTNFTVSLKWITEQKDDYCTKHRRVSG
jgi:hypothetical protein